MIDLRSDTSTLPTQAMRRAMAEAELGNEDWTGDPTLRRLETRTAELLGKEDAVFCLGGTMCNLIAVMAQTEPEDAILVGERFHIFDYEGPAMERVARVRLLTAPDQCNRGQFHLLPDEAVAKTDSHRPPPRLLCLENTVNSAQGALIALDHMAELHRWAKTRDMAVHLDGARFFTACCALNIEPSQLAAFADTVMVVFTKALAAPGGACLAGSREVIERARRARWMLGGNWKQGGVLAAACLVALDTMRHRIADDFQTARLLAEDLDKIDGVAVDLENIVTNILHMHLVDPNIDPNRLQNDLEHRGAWIGRFKDTPNGKRCRLVTHHDVDKEKAQRFGQLVREAIALQR